VGGAWLALILGLTIVDALIGPSRDGLDLRVVTPATLSVGASGTVTVRAAFRGTAPRAAEAAIETNARLTLGRGLAVMRLSGGAGAATSPVTPLRRGQGMIERLWLRWRGPFGLVWKQVVEAPGKPIAVVPNVRAVRDEAIRLFARDATFGIKTQIDTGDGSEFHALREMVAGMDSRTIDWKQSARHGVLLGKEFRTERNHPVVFAIDTGRVMCEPLAGVPRIDRAINASLLLAWVSLKLGDRAAIFGFDARPRLFSGLLSGARAFPHLQRLAAGLDYWAEETNYTLGFTQLGAALGRRSLLVVFTDFADPTSAELMLETLSRLLRRHLILFVVMRDEELEAIARHEPIEADDVSRAVTAAALLKERELVVGRLRRMGAHIVDAPAESIGPALISAYLDLKRRDLM
ncbi:MAG TPA: DUF58 domain-containing protein, partial [Caulobacteraceae bacterium]|nr:DUF58 domain-containing protein [Caulobacteraceae bacterium]